MTTIQELQEITKSNAIAIKELRKSTKELKESIYKHDQRALENEEVHKQMKKELWGIWQSQEEVWIDLFRRNMKHILKPRWIEIETVTTKIKNIRNINWEKIEWEYDLIWINWKDVVVVEVKNKLRNENINKFVNKQLPRFKILFPDFENYNLYWWIGGLIVTEAQEKQAEKAWLFVFTQWKNWNATIMNKENFKAKIF